MTLLLLAVPLAAMAATDAKVSDVTVFSNRAQVTRTARVPVSGTTTVELGPFFEPIDRSSLRVEVDGAELRRADLVPTRVDGFSSAEAKALIERLEALSAEIVQAEGEVSAHREQLDQLSRLQPTFPKETEQRPPPKLNAQGWSAGLQFAAEREERLQNQLRALSVRLEELREKQQTLSDQARLLGSAERREGLNVVVTLAGSGTARVQLTYLVSGAQWVPSYELRLLPERSEVEVQFSGRVNQQTGADWNGVELVLSTALPDRPAELPKLLTWKIGARDRFIPTPQPVADPVPPPPPPAPPPIPLRMPETDQLRIRLNAAASAGLGQVEVGGVEGGVVGGVMGGMAADQRSTYGAPSAMPPAPPPGRPAPRPTPSRQPTRDVVQSAPSMAPQAYEESVLAGTDSDFNRAVTSSMALSAPPSYRRPFDPLSSSAGGLDLSFKALRSESLASGSGARRVPLRVERWPVSVERRVYPALFPEAYLVAELKSPSKETLPQGEARLFVGEDPSGVATMPLTSPGETFTLPLGVDHAVKPVRNVELVTGETGFFGKKDVNTYEVTIELVNPYPKPIALRVFDQVPLANHEDVEAELLGSKPLAIQTKETGALEWRLTLDPGKKTVLSFRYALKKPKDTRFFQEAQ